MHEIRKNRAKIRGTASGRLVGTNVWVQRDRVILTFTVTFGRTKTPSIRNHALFDPYVRIPACSTLSSKRI